MPNRIIKESICVSETIDELKPDEECFFYRLMVNCDDYGRMDARASILLAKCFPLKIEKMKAKDIEKLLNALVNHRLIFIYGEGKYLQVVTWDKHQQIRAKRSKFPQPTEEDINRYQLISDDCKCPRNPIQSESNPNPNTNPNTNPISSIYTSEFELFWSEYPRSENKSQTFNNWKSQIKKGLTPEIMIQAAKRYKAKCIADKKEKEYCYISSNFLGKANYVENYIDGGELVGEDKQPTGEVQEPNKYESARAGNFFK